MSGRPSSFGPARLAPAPDSPSAPTPGGSCPANPRELQQLLARQAALKQELTAKKKALQEAQRRQRHTLTRQIRRAQARLSTADRKRRTRRLILLGSYIEHTTQADPAEHDRLLHGLNGFLERDQDRALFDLPPRHMSDSSGPS